jgi:hypothetical protein
VQVHPIGTASACVGADWGCTAQSVLTMTVAAVIGSRVSNFYWLSLPRQHHITLFEYKSNFLSFELKKSEKS